MLVDQLECVCSNCGAKQFYIRVLIHPKEQLVPANIKNHCNCCGEELASKDIIWKDIVGPAGEPGET